MKKLKTVRFSTPKGERSIQFRPVKVIPSDKVLCDEDCPYGKMCSFMRDPRDPENPKLTFNDFCGSLGEGEDEDSSLTEMVPVEGTVEQNLNDFEDIFQVLLKEEKYVKVSDLIKYHCSKFCDMHTEDRSQCTSSNKMCVLHDLYSGPKEVVNIPEENPEETKSENAENNG